MSPAPLTLAIALLLIAAAILAWWAAVSRQRRQEQAQHLQRHLQGSHDQLPASSEVSPVSGPRMPRHPLDDLLTRAGMTPGWGTPILLVAVFVIVVVLAAWRMQNILGGAIAATIFTALLIFWFGFRIQRQRNKLVADLPDFLENMVRLISIGQSLPMAFQNASSHTKGPLHALLEQVLRRMRAGVDLEDALQTAAAGYRIKELSLLESVLRMSGRYGGRTDQILQRMSDFMRDLEQAQQELHSITSETRMASWVLGLLPLVSGGIMMMLDPAFFTPMFHEPLGHRLLLIALCMETLGAFLLYRLAKSL